MEKFSTGRVGGSWNLNVWLDLSDLTEFTIPNPCYEAFGLVRKLQDGVDDLEDSAEIKQHELFSRKQGFSLRLTVVSLAIGLVTV